MSALPWQRCEVVFECDGEPTVDHVGRVVEHELLHPLPPGWDVEDTDVHAIVFSVAGQLLVKDGEQVLRLLQSLGLVKKEIPT